MSLVSSVVARLPLLAVLAQVLVQVLVQVLEHLLALALVLVQLSLVLVVATEVFLHFHCSPVVVSGTCDPRFVPTPAGGGFGALAADARRAAIKAARAE